jgi:hypothetical protein
MEWLDGRDRSRNLAEPMLQGSETIRSGGNTLDGVVEHPHQGRFSPSQEQAKLDQQMPG